MDIKQRVIDLLGGAAERLLQIGMRINDWVGGAREFFARIISRIG